MPFTWGVVDCREELFNRSTAVHPRHRHWLLVYSIGVVSYYLFEIHLNSGSTCSGGSSAPHRNSRLEGQIFKDISAPKKAERHLVGFFNASASLGAETPFEKLALRPFGQAEIIPNPQAKLRFVARERILQVTAVLCKSFISSTCPILSIILIPQHNIGETTAAATFHFENILQHSAQVELQQRETRAQPVNHLQTLTAVWISQTTDLGN